MNDTITNLRLQKWKLKLIEVNLVRRPSCHARCLRQALFERKSDSCKKARTWSSPSDHKIWKKEECATPIGLGSRSPWHPSVTSSHSQTLSEMMMVNGHYQTGQPGTYTSDSPAPGCHLPGNIHVIQYTQPARHTRRSADVTAGRSLTVRCALQCPSVRARAPTRIWKKWTFDIPFLFFLACL